MSPESPREAGRERQRHVHDYDSTGHCKVCGALRCPNCGRSEAEHDGTERYGCLVFSESEPMESQHHRNERAKATAPQPTLCSVCAKPFTIDQHEQALRGTHDACSLGSLAYWEDVEGVPGLRTLIEPRRPATPAARSDGSTEGHAADVLPQGMTFHAGELGDAYIAGAKSARAHHPASDELIARSCDAYVKHAHLVRIDARARLRGDA